MCGTPMASPTMNMFNSWGPEQSISQEDLLVLIKSRKLIGTESKDLGRDM